MQPQPLTDPDRPPEHAFGRIHQITVPVGWAPTPKNPRKKIRAFHDAMTRTWSVNGVGFTSVTDPQVVVAAVLTVRIGPVDGEVVVRSTYPTEIPGQSYYGVEFIGDGLQTVARDLISIHLRRNPEDRPDTRSPLELEDPHQKLLGDWT